MNHEVVSCNICIDTFNKSTRSIVECPKCTFTCCKTCVKTYLLGINNPICMNCKKEWDRKILFSSLGNTFLTGQYKIYREGLLFDLEKSMLPEAQLELERRDLRKKTLENLKLLKINIDSLNLKRCQLKHKIFNISAKKPPSYIDILKTLRNEVKIFDKQIRECTKKKNLLANELQLQNRNRNQNRTVNPENKVTFVKKCFNNDCRGFLNTSYHCSLCETYTCKECGEIKEKGNEELHECKPENVETIKLLVKDTKNCPGCGTLIHKISGCNQMFCTTCHIAFDWRTNQQVNGPIHNPHYFEWSRQNGGHVNIPQNACREFNNFYIQHLSNKLRNYPNNLFSSKIRIIETVFMDLLHLKYNTSEFRVDRLEDNREIRIKYLQKEITENEFKKLIFRREKQYQKYSEIYNLLTMFYNCATDLVFNHFDSEILDPNVIENFRDECSKLAKYVDANLQDISNVYKCKNYTLFTKFTRSGQYLYEREKISSSIAVKQFFT